MPGGRTLREVVAQSVKDLREDRKWSQEQLARRLQRSGLGWTRAQVTDLERGRKQDVSLAEALLLAEAFGVPLADLVPAEGTIRLGSTKRPARALHDVLAGHPPLDPDLRGPTEIPGVPYGPHWVKVSPDGTSQIFSDAEMAMARMLRYPVERIQATSRRLWEGGLDTETDRSLAQTQKERMLEEQRRSSGIGAGAPPPDPAQVRQRLAEALRRAMEAEDAAAP